MVERAGSSRRALAGARAEARLAEPSSREARNHKFLNVLAVEGTNGAEACVPPARSLGLRRDLPGFQPLESSMKQLVHLALVSMALSTAGLAQQSGQPGSGEPLNQLFPGLFGQAHFGKVVAGEFTGDLTLDAVVMDDDRARLAIAPETFDSVVDLPGVVHDIAALRGIVESQDLVVTVGPAGLAHHRRDYAQSQWVSTTIRDSTTGWVGGSVVRVGELDGAGGLDLVGCSGDSVLTELGDGNGGFSSGTSFDSFGGAIYDIQLFNFDVETVGPQVDEIALFTPYGVEVYRLNGTYAGSFAWPASMMHSTVVSSGSGPRERLALVTQQAGKDWLVLFDTVTTEGPYDLGQAGVVALAAADADGDGDSELFLSLTSERKLWKLESLGVAIPSYDTIGITKYGYGYSGRDPALNAAGLAPGDFDSDGVLDILAPAQGDLGPIITARGTLELVRVGSSSSPSKKVSVYSATYHKDLLPGYPTTFYKAFEMQFSDPVSLLTPGAGEQLMLHVTAWHTPDFGIETAPRLYDEVSMDLPVTASYMLELPPGYSLQQWPDIYSVVVRQVILSGGQIVRQGPALVAMLTGEANAAILMSDPTLDSTLQIVDPDDGVPTGGGVGFGGTVPPTEEEQQPM